MARLMSKNLSNYLSLGVGGLGPFLSGLSGISATALINITSVNVGANDNAILTVINNGINIGISFGIDGSAVSGKGRLRIGSRSVSTDARQSITGATELDFNTWYQVGFHCNISADLQYVVLNGVVDANTPAPVYANGTWTYGVPTVADGIGCYAPGSGSDVTTARFDGSIAELAIYNTDLHPNSWESLGLGRRIPRKVFPQALLAYYPLDGRGATEPSYAGLVDAPVGTITGSVPSSDHPRVLR